MKIAFGPIGKSGSSRYMEAVMACLADRADVVQFWGFPDSRVDRIVWLKMSDRLAMWGYGRDLRNVVFMPIDKFQTVEAATALLAELPTLRLVVAPSQRWIDEVKPQVPCKWLPHPILHVDERSHEWTNDGPILCVAAAAYAPDVKAWLEEVNPPRPVRILASSSERFVGRPGDIVREWSPELQRKWQQRCVAAVDVKSDCFWHRTKPETKAMEMLAAGLPVAVHRRSAAASSSANLMCELGTGRGLPRLDEMEWLLSKELHDMVQEMRPDVSRTYSPQTVADLLWSMLR